MTTLITGAAGFIGFHVARRLLARGDDVIGIDCVNDYYDPRLKEDRLAQLKVSGPGRFELERVNFSDHEALGNALEGRDFDRMVHLGAQAGVRYSIDNPRAYVQSNLV